MGSLCYEVLLLAAILMLAGWVFLSGSLDPGFRRPLLQIFLIAVTGTYFVFCWTHSGQTLPMETWRIRLVPNSGGKISLRIAIHRYLLALITLGLCGFGFIWALFDRDHQFLHDRLAGTKIVKCNT
jgi:uncharacterized RDD family membrane protein YckC